MSLVVDALGTRCPVPVVELARRIGEVAVGEDVEVLADDPAARHDIPAWCRLRSQSYLGERPLDPADLARGSAFTVRRRR